MKNPSELYVISEPESPTAVPAAPNVVPIAASPSQDPEPRERSWRDLMRRLQQKQR